MIVRENLREGRPLRKAARREKYLHLRQGLAAHADTLN
jgi:hypothetical protein